MQAVTEATLAQLQEPVWFTDVGKPDIGHKESETAIVVASWSRAMEHCLSQDWEELLHEAVNRYCKQLVVRSKERFQKMEFSD